MLWSFPVGRLFGVEVRVHWTLPLMIVFFALRAYTYGASPTFIGLFVVLPLVVLFASVLAHEFGHVFAAWSQYLHVGHIILTPIGGLVTVGGSRTPRSEFIVAVCGPLVNLVLAAIAIAAYLAIGGPPGWSLLIPWVDDGLFGQLWFGNRLGALLLHELAGTQLILVLFNVLAVAYPMDGGRMLMAALWSRLGYHRGLAVSCRVATFVALLMGVAGLFLNQTMLVLIAVFVWLHASRMLSQAHTMPDPGVGYDPRLAKLLWDQAQRRGPARAAVPARPGGGWWARRRQRRIDAVLAKVRAQGLPSLSAREKRLLTASRGPRGGA